MALTPRFHLIGATFLSFLALAANAQTVSNNAPANSLEISRIYISATAAASMPQPDETPVLKKLPDGSIAFAADTTIPDSGEVLMRVKLGSDYVLYKGSMAADAAVTRFGLPEGWTLRDAITARLHDAVYPQDRNEVAVVYYDRSGVLTNSKQIILYFCDESCWRTLMAGTPKSADKQTMSRDDQTISQYAKLAASCRGKRTSRCNDILLTLATLLEKRFAIDAHIEDYQCAVFLYNQLKQDNPNFFAVNGAEIKLDNLLKSDGITATSLQCGYELLSLIERR